MRKQLLLLSVLLFYTYAFPQCWKTINAKNGQSAGIKTDGTLWTWGFNGQGQLGDGSNVNRNTPTPINNSPNWKTISSGYNHMTAIKQDNTLWTWGLNNQGQLGTGTNANNPFPTQISNDTDWKDIAAGNTHTLA